MLRRPSGFQLLVLQAEVHSNRIFDCPGIISFLFRIAVLFVPFASSAHIFLLLVARLTPPGSDADVFFQRHSVYSQQASGMILFFSYFSSSKIALGFFHRQQLIDFNCQVRCGCKCSGLRGFKIRKGQVVITMGVSESTATFHLTLFYSPLFLVSLSPSRRVLLLRLERLMDRCAFDVFL